jgi:hypothetical protein
MKISALFSVKPGHFGFLRLSTAAASLCAGMAVAGDPAENYEPAESATAEETVEQAVRNDPAKAKPAESWRSGASTADPSPKDGAAPTPTSPHDPAPTKTAPEPVSDETLGKVVEAAADDSRAPEESWMRSKSGDEESPGDR